MDQSSVCDAYRWPNLVNGCSSGTHTGIITDAHRPLDLSALQGISGIRLIRFLFFLLLNEHYTCYAKNDNNTDREKKQKKQITIGVTTVVLVLLGTETRTIKQLLNLLMV
jgi:hypothetical protein